MSGRGCVSQNVKLLAFYSHLFSVLAERHFILIKIFLKNRRERLIFHSFSTVGKANLVCTIDQLYRNCCKLWVWAYFLNTRNEVVLWTPKKILKHWLLGTCSRSFLGCGVAQLAFLPLVVRQMGIPISAQHRSSTIVSDQWKNRADLTWSKNCSRRL